MAWTALLIFPGFFILACHGSTSPGTMPNQGSSPPPNMMVSSLQPQASTDILQTTRPMGDPNCTDTIDDCINYGHASCTGPYEAWANAHCRAFCGFCIPITTPFICEDKLNCAEYGDDLCTNEINEVFVVKNCLKYCHRCPGELTSPAPKTGCFDDFERCDEFGTSTCTNYPNWSKIYCAKYCGLCVSNETSTEAAATSVAASTSPGTTPLDSTCFDRKDCSGYNVHTDCCGKFEAFSRYNCPLHCGFCTPKVTEKPLCVDTIPNCDQYQADACTKYPDFAATKCAGFCGVCNRTPFVPPCARGTTLPGVLTTSTSPAEKKCKQEGRSYSQGESWYTTDCYQTCKCLDAETNNITCGPLDCPKPQPDCDLVYVPGGCCPVLKCSFLLTIHGERTQEELQALMAKPFLIGKK